MELFKSRKFVQETSRTFAFFAISSVISRRFDDILCLKSDEISSDNNFTDALIPENADSELMYTACFAEFIQKIILFRTSKWKKSIRGIL